LVCDAGAAGVGADVGLEMPDSPRRFPTPWQAERLLGGYVIRDASGQALAYVCSCDTEAEARKAKVLTADEARRIAVNIAAAGAVGEG
jgi:hypothetical protein